MEKIMKMLNKTLVAGAILAFAAFGSASADELKFENEISTDTVYLGDLGCEDTIIDWYNDYIRFPGIRERMTVEYTSEKVDAKVRLGFWLYGYNTPEYTPERQKRTIIGLDSLFWDSDETYIKFRPIEILQIALNAKEMASGSYFPVLDTNVDLGNYTGDFGLLLKPIDGLSIGAGMDLPSTLFDDLNDDPDKIILNFGAEYTFENIGSFALTFNDVFNHFGFGAYAKINAINALDIFAGFAYQEDTEKLAIEPLNRHYNPSSGRNREFHVNGNILMNAGAEYKGIDKLTLAAELATNFTAEADATHDFYTGLKAAYDINDAFSLSCKSFLTFDFADSRNNDDNDYRDKALISIYPEVAYKLGNNTFKAGFKMEFYDDEFVGSIPLSWTYAF